MAQWQAFKILGRIYFPRGLTRQRLFGICFGGGIGAFVGGLTAAGFEVAVGIVVVAALVGAVLGSVAALGLVPESR